MAGNLALDSNNDILVGRSISRISGADYTAQLIKNRLTTNLGSWVHDTSLGIPWTSYIFEKGAQSGVTQGILKTTIEETNGVSTVTSIEVTADNRNRKLNVAFEATSGDVTISGEV